MSNSILKISVQQRPAKRWTARRLALGLALLALVIACAALAVRGLPTAAAQAAPFVEQNGIVVMEAENGTPQSNDRWDVETSVADYRGSGYLRWNGPNQYSDKTHGVMAYRIKITKPGTYQMRLRSFHNPAADGEAGDKQNDAWTSGELNSDTLYKTFRSGGTAGQPWNFRSQWEPTHANFRNPEYTLAAGEYTFKLAARSEHYMIDRIYLYHSDVAESTALNADLPESPRDGSAPAATATPIPPTAAPPANNDGTVSGDLTKWHPVTVSFAGPTASETDDSPNPFLDYRLSVTFSGPGGRTHVVPGFFDGDGNGGGEGNVWRARFAPDAAGQWTYTASFRSGNDVAVSLDNNAGSATSFDGVSGSFNVADRDGSAPGFLKWGNLEYVGQHYLKFADGPHWIKGGADSPENFFGYADFDNTEDQGCIGAVHQFQPHVGDWQNGDPTWNNGKGKGIIGALNYLSSAQVNSIYFLPMNLGGDGCETYPFVGASGSDFDNTHYDISKLTQWNTVMSHAQAKSVALHFVLNETEEGNEKWLDGGNLGVERKLFYRELVARFGHHLAIKWNLSEESNFYGDARLKDFASYISALDWAEHQLTVHTVPNALGTYDGLLGNSDFDATSIQYNPDQANDHVETMRQRSADAGRPWVIDMDENNPAGSGLTDSNADDLRKRVLYDIYFSGGNIEWYFGYHDLPLGGDLRTEDFRTRAEMWRYMGFARAFMQENLPFWEMQPADNLLGGEDQSFGGGQVFAKPGEVYAVYFPVTSSESALLDVSAVPSGTSMTFRWFNPRSGQFEGAAKTVSGGGSIGIGIPPSDAGNDWVLLVQRGDGSSLPTSTPTSTPPPGATPTPGPTATVTPPPSGSSAVTSLTLVNADTDQDIRELVDGDTINFAQLGTRNLSVRANTNPATVDNVRFEYDGDSSYQTESVAPYTLAGDRNGDYDAWTPSLGAHTLRAVPTAGGQEGAALAVSFTVIDDASQPTATPVAPTATPQPTAQPTAQPTSTPDSGQSVASFTLVNADMNEDIGPLADGDVLVLSELPTSNLNVRANAAPNQVGSVKFALNGNSNFRTENVVPYALRGDVNGNYYAWNPSVGQNTLTATPYSRNNAKGEAGNALSITFAVMEEPGDVQQLAPVVAEVGTMASLNGMIRLPAVSAAQDGGAPADVSLTLVGPDALETTVTIEADGSFEQTELAPGDYAIRLGLPEGLRVLNRSALQVTLEAGSSTELPDFGIVDASTLQDLFLPLVSR